MTTSILICDPKQQLAGEPSRYLTNFGFEIIGSVTSLRQAFALADNPAEPDLILFDLDVAIDRDPGGIHAIRSRFGTAKLVGFHDADVGEEHLVAGLSAGLDGFLLKDLPLPSLILSLVAVMADGVVLSRPLATLLRGDGEASDGEDAPAAQLADGGDPPAPFWLSAPAEGRPASLSVREQQILLCLLRGDSNKAIATSLDIKESTVKSHIKAVMRKINVSKRNQVVIWAVQHGIVSADDSTFLPSGAAGRSEQCH